MGTYDSEDVAQRAFDAANKVIKKTQIIGDVKSMKKINSEILASEALKLMNKNKITQLIVEDKNNYLGIIHLHNILNEGIS